jgi:hypothetical protein
MVIVTNGRRLSLVAASSRRSRSSPNIGIPPDIGIPTGWAAQQPARSDSAARIGHSTPPRHNSLDPCKLDLLPAVQQRRRVALQRSGYLEPVKVRK